MLFNSIYKKLHPSLPCFFPCFLPPFLPSPFLTSSLPLFFPPFLPPIPPSCFPYFVFPSKLLLFHFYFIQCTKSFINKTLRYGCLFLDDSFVTPLSTPPSEAEEEPCSTVDAMKLADSLSNDMTLKKILYDTLVK